MSAFTNHSFVDEYGKPEQIFLPRGSLFQTILSLIAATLGSGFFLFGLLIALVYWIPSDKVQATPTTFAVANFLAAFFVGLACFLFYGPVRLWIRGRDAFAVYHDKLVAFNKRTLRAIPLAEIVGVQRRGGGAVVLTATGSRVRIPRGIEHAAILIERLEHAVPSSRFVPPTPAPTPTPAPVPTLSAKSSAAPEVQPTLASQSASVVSHSETTTQPLRGSNPTSKEFDADAWKRFDLLAYGLLLIIGAIYMHSTFAEMANGKRESVTLWIGFAMLYDLFGPTLAVWISGVGGLLLVGLGILKATSNDAKSERRENPSSVLDDMDWEAKIASYRAGAKG